jgi:hypothetical protein
VDFGVTGRTLVSVGASLHVAVSDADLNDTFEAAFACDVPLDAEALRAGEMLCESPAHDGSVAITFQPL